MQSNADRSKEYVALEKEHVAVEKEIQKHPIQNAILRRCFICGYSSTHGCSFSTSSGTTR